MAEQGAPELELLRYASDGTDDEVSRATQQRQIDSMSVRLHWTVGRAGLPYGVSVGRLHASDVLPRVRFDAAEAEAEEGLAFAEAFGVGVSLHFKLGKLLLSLLVAAAALQVPALVLYARRGRLVAGGGGGGGPAEAATSWLDGAWLARYSMAAVPPFAATGEAPWRRRRDVFLVACSAAAATFALLFGSAAARDLVKRDAPARADAALALRTLAPRPEHYALLLRDVNSRATPAAVRAEVVAAVADAGGGDAAVARVAVHYALRPLLGAAAEAMACEAAARRAAKRAAAADRGGGAGYAADRAGRAARRSERARARLVAAAREPRETAIAAFVVFESPAAARTAAGALARRWRRSLDTAPLLPSRRPRSAPRRGEGRSLVGASALARARPAAAPAPNDIIWENLEVGEASRLARRLLVRAATLAVILAGLCAVYRLRGRAIDEERGADAPPGWAGGAANATAAADGYGGGGGAGADDAFASAKRMLDPYLTRAPSGKRRALGLVGVVVCLNALLRILVRRGAVFGAHSTRTTEQSGAVTAYWAATTLNTVGCYSLAAWRGGYRRDDGAALSRWYADVGAYLLTTLLWEALAPPAGAALRACFRADALRELYRVRAFFWRRRGLPGVARHDSLGGDESRAGGGRGGALSNRCRPFYDRYVAAPLAQYVAAPPWDPTARAADALRVFFIGAAFGAGQPLLPFAAAVALACMLAHDKWALLRERRPPPRLGAHLARTAAQIAPFAAPIHALLALWTWGDPAYTAAEPFYWTRDLRFSASAATWPLALALFACVVSNVALRAPDLCARTARDGGSSGAARWPSPRAPRTPPRRPAAEGIDRTSSFERVSSWNRLSEDARAAPAATPARGALVGAHPPWRDAVVGWERDGITHSYDIYDDPHPLLRTRHLIRRTSVLSSTTATSAAAVLGILAAETKRKREGRGLPA